MYNYSLKARGYMPGYSTREIPLTQYVVTIPSQNQALKCKTLGGVVAKTNL